MVDRRLLTALRTDHFWQQRFGFRGAGRTRGTVQPLDAVIRDHIAPVLVGAGFKKTGRLFTLENEYGDRAFVQVRSFKLGRRDAEFDVDLHIQPKIWHDWLTRDGGDTILGIWTSRLRPRGRDMWSMDLGDGAAANELADALSDALPGFLCYLDAENLLAYARNPTDSPPKVGGGLAVLPTLLAIWGSSDELEARLTRLASESSVERGGFDTTGFIGFIRVCGPPHSGPVLVRINPQVRGPV